MIESIRSFKRKEFTMAKIAVLTDSNSGITQDMAKELGVSVLPMPVYINEKLYFEDVTLTQEQFYNFLEMGVNVHTSQPSPGDVMERWDELLKDYDEIVHIPMSSGLSSTCENSIMLARNDEYAGRVFVVDNQRISVTMLQSVLDAKKMAAQGMDGAEIKKRLEDTKLDSSIYISVDTMEYLKKGGRVTAAAAGIATILNIKPVLQIQGGKLDQYSKARGMKSAKKDMIKALKQDLEGRFKDFVSQGRMRIYIAYTKDISESLVFEKEIKEAFPFVDYEIIKHPLSLSVSCHIGPGALAVACSRILV